MKRLNQTMNSNLKILLIVLIISIFSLFLLASFLTSANLKYNLSSTVLHDRLNNFSNETFIYGLGLENPYFAHGLSKDNDTPNLYKVAIQFFTKIKIGDIRSLLGNELPMFTLFDTEIVIAGEGTDYTNLPIESAPPIEVLLEQREIAEERLNTTKQEDTAITNQTTNGKKTVYVYHSHSWESFIPLLKNVEKPNDAVSSNPKANVIALGAKLKKELEAKGIGVEHDTTNVTKELLDNGWDYYDSYTYARNKVQSVMGDNKNLNFFIDIHRDSQPKKITTATINGNEYARLFFIVGKEHKNFEKNLHIAKQLNERLEKKFPGISRGVFLKTKDEGNGVYNQDLSNNALLIEIGGVENTLSELYRTTEVFANIFSDYYWDVEKVSAED